MTKNGRGSCEESIDTHVSERTIEHRLTVSIHCKRVYQARLRIPIPPGSSRSSWKETRAVDPWCWFEFHYPWALRPLAPRGKLLTPLQEPSSRQRTQASYPCLVPPSCSCLDVDTLLGSVLLARYRLEIRWLNVRQIRRFTLLQQPTVKHRRSPFGMIIAADPRHIVSG